MDVRDHRRKPQKPYITVYGNTLSTQVSSLYEQISQKTAHWKALLSDTV